MEIYFKTSDHSSGHCHALYHLWIFQSERNNFRWIEPKVSRQIVTVCDTLFHQDLAEETIEHYTEKIEYPLRKAAHATEYLILTLLAALPLYTYGLRGKNCFWLYFYSVSSAHPGTNSTSPLFPAGLPRLQMYL